MMTPSDYLTLYQTCCLTADPLKLLQLDSVVKTALTNQQMYVAVQTQVTIPWPLIAAIHFRESNQNFKRHLHNGDPLSGRTIHVPSGRPTQGDPPFTWVESACDALAHFWKPASWDIPGCLEFLERYNGLGYQRLGVNTPYLWDYTDKYSCGLFTADGKFDPKAVESRPGAVSLLKTLAAKGVSLDFSAFSLNPSLLH